MTDDEIARLAEILVVKVKEAKHDFWIDPESHYNDHIVWRTLTPDDVKSVQDLVKLFVFTKGMFWKAFLGFAIIGAIAIVVVGFGFKGDRF